MMSSLQKHFPRRCIPISKRFLNIVQRRTYFEDKFNSEKQEKILNVLNTPGLDFKLYPLAKKHQTTIIEQINKGPIQSLDDLLLSLDAKALEKFYKGIIAVVEGRHKTLRPPLRPHQSIQDSTQATSICLSPTSISWSVLSRCESQFKLESMKTRTINYVPKMQFYVLCALIQEAVAEIPPSELYIVEDLPSITSNVTPRSINFLVQVIQIRSFLLGLLAVRNNGSQQVLSLNNLHVARLMNLKIGGEMVSGQLAVEGLFKHENVLKVDPSTNFMFQNMNNKVEKENLASSVLLNIAYWKLMRAFPTPSNT